MDFQSFYSSSRGNLYRVTCGDSALLIECGVSIKEIRRALNFELSRISGCLVTHSHKDHCRGATDLMGLGIDCYMTEETRVSLTQSTVPHYACNVIEPLQQFRVGGFTVLPFPTQHDCPGSVGYLIQGSDGEKCLVALDTYYVRYRFTGLSIVALECNYSARTLDPDLDPARKARLLKSHFSLENVVRFLQAQDLSLCREIHLLHLSDGNSDEAMFRREVERATGIPTYVAPSRPRKGWLWRRITSY